ncbi:MAG: hypothetical protein BEN19_02945 [Epulopiscium sp. Nuni2H_MBin003]|nr:MAG: hypothetical protein BEN19_02945 [Epulopiscium sp. Nuni2H_MBin003]
MNTWVVVALWVIAIGGVLVGLYFWGKKLQDRYAEQQQMINEHKQAVQIFVIDKKKDKMDNLKLPKIVKDQIPKRQRNRKIPVIIAKVGPQIQTLMCDENVYNTIPVKKNVKVEVAGVLVVNILSGKLAQAEKVGFRQRMLNRANNLREKSAK